MYTLAFDTTAACCSIALLKDDKISRTFEQEMDFGQAEVLMPEIKNLLAKERISFSDLNLVVVCTGPGSFTGVRSSISAARTFGLTSDKLTVAGVSAFEAYVKSLAMDEIADLNVVIIETKRDDFYYQIFDSSLQKRTEPTAAQRADIIAELRDKKVSLIGDGVERFLSSPSGLSLHAIRMEKHLPIEYLGWCGLKHFLSGRPDFPKPLYLRAPDVCVK